MEWIDSLMPWERRIAATPLFASRAFGWRAVRVFGLLLFPGILAVAGWVVLRWFVAPIVAYLACAALGCLMVVAVLAVPVVGLAAIAGALPWAAGLCSALFTVVAAGVWYFAFRE